MLAAAGTDRGAMVIAMGNAAIRSARENQRSFLQPPPPPEEPPLDVPLVVCWFPCAPLPPDPHVITLKRLPSGRSVSVLSVVAARTVTPKKVVDTSEEPALA